MRIIQANPKETIVLGRRGENDATRVMFDLSAFKAFGEGGTFALVHRRNGDPAAYPCMILVVGNTASWTVKASDVANVGTGECELIYSLGDRIVKSVIFSTAVRPALDATEEPPEPWQEWVDDVISARDEASASADRAEEASAHYPYINTEKHWMVWDVEAEEFVDTGIVAEGEDGYTPQRGVDYWTGEDKEEILSDTETYVDEKIQPIEEDVDAIEEKIPEEASEQNQLADKQYVDEKTASLEESVDGIEAKIPAQASPDNQLADKAYVDNSIDEATSDMATQTWVEEQGYLKEHQSLEAYRTSEAQDVIDADKVSYSAQSKTDAQKAQARSNIFDYDDVSQIINITKQSITLGEVSDMLDDINEDGKHVFFDVSALGAKMYLCTISIDTTTNTYTILDLVLGRTASGIYESTKLLTMAIAQASNLATQRQIDTLQHEIDELGGSEVIKDLDALGTVIENGTSPDLISAGDSIDFNWVKTVLGTTTHGLTVTCSDEDKFINGVGECEEKDYLLVYNGTAWTYNEEAIDLAEWGLSVSGTPQSGEVMTVNVTTDPVEYVFTGYDDMAPHSSAVPHNWVMEQKCAPSTKVWDTYEALFCIYEGKTVPAGNWHVRSHSYRSVFEVDIYFTLSTALGKADRKVQMVSNGYKTADITNADGVTKTGVYVISTMKPADYKTGANVGNNITPLYAPESGVEYTELASLNVEGEDPVVAFCQTIDTCALGSNRADDSNLDQFLNDDTKGDGYEPTHLCDVASSYNRGKGFLWGLDPRVKALMLEADVKCIAGYGDPDHAQGSYYNMTRKVFLLSMKEMSFNVNTSEGNVTDLYNEYTGGVLTNNATEGRAKYNKAGGTLNDSRWSRSSLSGRANRAYLLTATGAYGDRYAFYGQYYAPAFIIGKASSNQ